MTFPQNGARKLALDQESFQQLLAAAYTLQENKDVLQGGNSEQDSAAVFSDIAALRSKVLEAPNSGSVSAKPRNAVHAAALVAECLQRLTNADGASVCLIINGYLKCAAFAGTAVKVPGGSVASNSLVATERLRNGSSFLSANACSDIRLDPAQCVNLKIGSLLAVPITVKSDVAGLIELRWNKAEAFREGDERICQLLVELMSEVLDGEAVQVNAPVTHAVQGNPPRGTIAEIATPVATSKGQDQQLSSAPAIADAQAASSDHICRVCGKPLNDDLNFCGSCGMLSASPDNGMQGKWASMWFMQQAQKAVGTGEERRERLWPIHVVNAQEANTGSNATTDSMTEIPDDDDAGGNQGTSSDRKRSPRSVLAALKSRFRPRAMGQ